MAFKSIIDIDINDAKFKDFLEAFQRYKDAAKDAPEDWHKVAQAISGASDEMQGFADNQRAALGGADKATRNLSRSLKGSTASQQGFANALKGGTSGLKKFSLESAATALGLDEMGGPIAALVAGLAAIVVGAGAAALKLDKLTASKFKSARELGMSIAQQQAFENYGSQLFENPNATLTAIRNAKINPAESAPLLALGIGKQAISKDSTAQLAFLVAEKAHERLKGVPENVRGAVWQALTQGKLGGLNQAELFNNTHMAQINRYRAEYERHVHAYAISTQTARRAVNVGQAASELKGRVVTDVENVAASHAAGVASMATIRGARSTLSAGYSLYQASLKAGSAIYRGASDAASALEEAGRKVAGFLSAGHSLKSRGEMLKGFMERDTGTSREAGDKAAYEAFNKRHPGWDTSQIAKAVRDGMANTHIHVHVHTKSGPGTSVAGAAHAAAR